MSEGTSSQFVGRFIHGGRKRRSRRRNVATMMQQPRQVMRGRRRLARIGGLLGIEKKYLDTYASALVIVVSTDCAGGELQPEGGCTQIFSASG